MVRCSGARDTFANHALAGRGAAPTDKYAFDGHKGNLHVGVTGRTVLCDY